MGIVEDFLNRVPEKNKIQSFIDSIPVKNISTQTPTAQPNVEQKDIDWLESRAKAATGLNSGVLGIAGSTALVGKGIVKTLQLGRNIPAGIWDWADKAKDPTGKEIAKTLADAMDTAIKQDKGVGDVLIEKYGTPDHPTYSGSGIYGSALVKTIADLGIDLTNIPIGKALQLVARSTGVAKSLAKVAGKSAVKVLENEAIEKVSKSVVGEFHSTQKAIDEGFNAAKKTIGHENIPATASDMELFNKISNVLGKVKPMIGKQENIYTAERKIRLARALEAGGKAEGLDIVPAMKSKMGGEMEKIQFESIAKDFGEEEIKRIFQITRDSENLVGHDKLNALNGLQRMFGLQGAALPRKSELALLERVFPKQVIDDIMKARPFLDKIKDVGQEIINLPRALQSSWDMSAPFRQGIFMIGRKEFWQNMAPMVKSFGSDKVFKELELSIMNHPNYQLMQDSGLGLTGMTKHGLREEAFLSRAAEKVPGVKASERAYVSFLNKTRADVFNNLVDKAKKLGRNPEENMELSRQIASFVNNATGRGKLPSGEGIANVLNAAIYSPRLVSSRLTLLNPAYYVKADPFVRKEALKSLAAYLGYLATVYGTAKASGLDFGLDPRSADFAKVKKGNVRVDVTGGFGQYIRTFSQIASGKMINSSTGKEYTLGEGYKPRTRLDIVLKNLEYKLSPIASLVTNLFRGTTAFGEDVNVKKEIATRMVPMITQDLKELYDENPDLLPIGFLSAVGFGVQVYKEKSPLEKIKEKRIREAEKYSPENIRKRREDMIKNYGVNK